MTTICICGAGTMGSGIAQVAASAGYSTILFDLETAVLQKARTKIISDLDVLVTKSKITADQREKTLGHLRFTSEINDCVASLIIEAIVEKAEVKAELFKQLSEINDSHTVFATNTSSLSVSAIAERIPLPHRVAGLHFFNPAPIMKLVEVVRAKQTADDVIEQLVALTRTFGKTPVVCKDAPGFIVNRVARPFYIESLRLLESGRATVESVDRLLESRGFRMGPFKLMDLIGNDVNYAVSCSVHAQLGEPERLKPSYIQKEKVEQGKLGKKSGEGYYSYLS